MTANSLEKLTDEQLVAIAKKGKESTESEVAATGLVKRYNRLVRSIASYYFLQGGDRDSVISYGLEGLAEAIQDFNPDKKCSFRTFAKICITRQIQDGVTGAARKKHIPLNTAVSLETVVSGDRSVDERQLIEMIRDLKALNPEDQIIIEEDYRRILGVVKAKMTYLEKQAFLAYLAKEPYKATAERLGKNVKSIDNASQRSKRKVRKVSKQDLEEKVLQSPVQGAPKYQQEFSAKEYEVSQLPLQIDSEYQQEPVKEEAPQLPLFEDSGRGQKFLAWESGQPPAYWYSKVIIAYVELTRHLVNKTADRVKKAFDYIYFNLLERTDKREYFCGGVIRIFESVQIEPGSTSAACVRHRVIVRKIIDSMYECANKYY